MRASVLDLRGTTDLAPTGNAHRPSARHLLQEVGSCSAMPVTMSASCQPKTRRFHRERAGTTTRSTRTMPGFGTQTSEPLAIPRRARPLISVERRHRLNARQIRADRAELWDVPLGDVARHRTGLARCRPVMVQGEAGGQRSGDVESTPLSRRDDLAKRCLAL